MPNTRLIIGEGTVILKRRLAIGCCKPQEGAKKMGPPVRGSVTRGRGSPDVGTFLIAMTQAEILFILVTCLMSPRNWRMMGGFHHWVVRQLSGRQPIRQVDCSWVYSALMREMTELLLEEVETYVAR